MKFVASTLSVALLTFAGVGCDDSAIAPPNDAEPAAPAMSDPAGGGQEYNPEPLGGGEPGGGNDPGARAPQAPTGGGANP